MMRYLFILMVLSTFIPASAQQNAPSEIIKGKQNYLAELKIAGKNFTNEFYPNYVKIHQLPEQKFISKIDSVRYEFKKILLKHTKELDKEYVQEQQMEISYYFDKLLIEYPQNNDIYAGKSSPGSSIIEKKLARNLNDFNTPSLLRNTDFINYVKAFLSLQTYLELNKNKYHTDNQQLNVVWGLISKYFTNTQCKDFWRSEYLFNHIENNGIKNIKEIYEGFKATCTDTAYLNKVNTIYTEDFIGRQGHLIKTYKNLGKWSLDLHIFLPDSVLKGTKKPVIIFFHGGSWSEGKPDWFFYGCENQAKKGWIAIAAEYRTYGRFGTLPFEAVMDAKSAIRWLREHAEEFNIDTNKIVASGNSAGGHLALSTALVDKWNEKTDHLAFSAIPNAIMVNSAVYDLTDQSTMWIRKQLKDKDLVKQISPNHLVKKEFPKTLIIHGTNDKNVPFLSAKLFTDKMKEVGNTTIQFEPLLGAEHFIWYHPTFSPIVAKLRNEFLSKLGY